VFFIVLDVVTESVSWSDHVLRDWQVPWQVPWHISFNHYVILLQTKYFWVHIVHFISHISSVVCMSDPRNC